MTYYFQNTAKAIIEEIEKEGLELERRFRLHKRNGKTTQKELEFMRGQVVGVNNLRYRFKDAILVTPEEYDEFQERLEKVASKKAGSEPK